MGVESGLQKAGETQYRYLYCISTVCVKTTMNFTPILNHVVCMYLMLQSIDIGVVFVQLKNQVCILSVLFAEGHCGILRLGFMRLF